MLLIKNGTVHVGNGSVQNNCDILIQDGLIKEIGTNITCENCKIIDAEFKEIFPGFIDPINSLGSMDLNSMYKNHNESTDPVTPEAEIKCAFSSDEIMYQELYKTGITTIGASPGNSNIVGGQTAVYNTYGNSLDDMLLKEPSGLKASIISSVKLTYGFNNRFPTCKSSMVQKLHNLFKKAQNSMSIGVSDTKSAPFIKVLNKEMPLFVTANKTQEIISVVNILKEFDIDLVICGGYEAFKCIDILIQNNIPLILGEQIEYSKGIYSNIDMEKIVEAVEKGLILSITLTSDDDTSGKVKYFWNVAELVKAGMNCETAVKVSTLYPAMILHIDDMLGSIEKDKFADIIIYNNNPFKYYNADVNCTVIKGQVVYTKEGDSICC